MNTKPFKALAEMIGVVGYKNNPENPKYGYSIFHPDISARERYRIPDEVEYFKLTFLSEDMIKQEHTKQYVGHRTKIRGTFYNYKRDYFVANYYECLDGRIFYQK